MDINLSSTPGRKRQTVLVPDINPRSFLFMFEKGDTGYAYSLRDYSTPYRVSEKYARELRRSAQEIRQMATQIFDAPYLDTHYLEAWHAYTVALNRQCISDDAASLNPPSISSPQGRADLFPMLCRQEFDALPKSAKAMDVRRMLESPQSEDWVTWNFLQLLVKQNPALWWTRITELAESANSNIDLLASTGDPHLEFWRMASSPASYERASRERMRASSDEFAVARSADPRPVEGNSEIDISIKGNSFLIFIEAKLGSDVSMRTTHDPSRNQIVRSIDCLLESAQGRTPYFWMLVKDAGAGRAYTQLMQQYRDHPETLAEALPHRTLEELRHVSRTLALITWRDLGEPLCEADPSEDQLTSSIKQEIWRRIA